jgi:hypothetical protein
LELNSDLQLGEKKMTTNVPTVNRPPTREEVSEACRLINSGIRGWHSGAERRAIAHAHDDPKLRHAAVVLDAYDAHLATQPKPKMRPTPRHRNLDGSFVSARYLRDVAKIGEQLRRAREGAE